MRKTLRALAALYIAYLVLTLLVITPALNFFPARYVDEHYSRQLQSKWVILNPFKLSLDLQQLALSETDGTDFLSLGQSSINLSLASLWRSGIVLDEVRLTDLKGRVAYLGEGKFNFTDLIPPPDTAQDSPEEEGSIGVTIDNLQFAASSISVEDQSRRKPYAEQWQDINLNAQGVSTVFKEGRPYTLVLTGPEGGRLEWRGNLSVAGANSQGSLTVSNLGLVNIGKIAEPWVSFHIDSGRLNVSGDYDLNWSGDLSYSVSDGELSINKLTVEPKPEAALTGTGLSLAGLSLTGISVDSSAQDARITLLDIAGLKVDGWMEGEQVSLVELLAGSAEEQAPAEPPAQATEEGQPWQVTLARAQLGGSELNWRSPFTEPAVTRIQNIEASVEKFTWPPQGDSPLALALVINETAKLKGDGALDFGSGNGNISYSLEELALPWFNPNLPDALKVTLTDGKISLAGQMTLSEFSPATIALDGTIAGFALNPEGSEEVLSGWDAVRLDGLSVNLPERQLALQRVAIDSYWGYLHIAQDGSVNATNLWSEGPEATADDSPEKTQQAAQEEAEDPTAADGPDTAAGDTEAGAESPQEAAPWQIDIPEITLTDSLIDFSDQSLPIPFRTVIGDLNGNVLGLSSNPGAQAEVDIKGAVGGSAPVTLGGTVAPLVTPLALDLALNFNGMDMALLTPYSGTYAGYEIERGLLNMDLEYSLENNLLKGDNHIVLDQLKLGEKIDSDKAIDVPLELAIAIMEDSSGVIDMKLPIQGDVSDPGFQIGGLVVKALIGLIREVVTAPFSLLANLVGSEEDLQHVSFPAGSAELDEAGHAKLLKLADALTQRPGIKLVINGRVNAVSDLEQLRRNALDLQLLEAGLSEEEIGAKGEAWEKEIASRFKALGAQPEGTDAVTLRDQYLQVAGSVQLAEGAMAELARQRAATAKSLFVTGAGLDPNRAVIGAAQEQESEDQFSGVELEIN